jgi:hypothetical protein
VVEFALKGVQVGVRNNTNPLITEHFATPLSRVQLRRGQAGAHLLLHLREAVQVTPSMKTGPSGTVIFEVTLPKPSGPYAAPKRNARSSKEGETAQEAKASSFEGESSAKESR